MLDASRTYTTTANLLASYQPSLLVTVATTQEVLHGANEAARAVPQVIQQHSGHSLHGQASTWATLKHHLPGLPAKRSF